MNVAPSTRARLSLVALLGAIASLGLASACLDDLAAQRLVDAGTSVPPDSAVPTSCGDGIIASLDDGGDAGESCDPGNGAPGCTPECRIVCTGIVGPAGHCYFLADPSSHIGAGDNCIRARGHLVTIGSAEELALVRSLVGDAGYRLALEEDRARGGYVTRRDEPGWPIGSSCPGCFAPKVDADGGFPVRADAGAEHACIASTANDEWLQVPCNESAGDYVTVCEREPPGQRAQYCGGPYCTNIPITSGRKRYVISLDLQTAEGAAEACAGYDGGRLALLDSRAEREQLAQEIAQLLDQARSPAETPAPGADDVWIGLARADLDAGWTWDDGVPADDGGRPAPWGGDEPKPNVTGRAFLRLRTSKFDVQLAGTDPEPKRRLFVCERP